MLVECFNGRPLVLVAFATTRLQHLSADNASLPLQCAYFSSVYYIIGGIVLSVSHMFGRYPVCLAVD